MKVIWINLHRLVGMGRTLVSLLLCPALCMGVVSLTISHTSWVRFHPGRRITLPCTETTPTGMVQYWHTPFGRVQNSSFHFNQEDVVAMQQDGSLQIPSTSHQHHGLYYCLHLVGKHATLTPYMLITSGQRDHGYKPRRVVRSVLTGQAERDVPVSDLVFKSAVAASVVVTFLVGFSFGALSRTLLDRCINWVRSLGHRRRYHGETVRMVFRKDPKGDSASLTVVTMENTNSSPPAKPKRSFRGKQYNGNTVYLEGCDQEREVKERERRDCKERSEREYDEEGHRYGHLPDPDPVDNCKPRPKQRSLSLTRLNAIMAAATASPLDPKSPQKHDPEQEDKDTPSPTDHQQRAVFQLGI
ncbi:hypothetical protein DPEC_G00247390 [Dallia pectoralis]|uniref:Uncharacterized protein n=1 Tax=Dallia pectoralis TaxID=75939 RepID=A0ACC2FWH0_DALPE|nr:hypothetical protein DPEC_G00247390 [Dallia pectoralis]